MVLPSWEARSEREKEREREREGKRGEGDERDESDQRENVVGSLWEFEGLSNVISS